MAAMFGLLLSLLLQSAVGVSPSVVTKPELTTIETQLRSTDPQAVAWAAFAAAGYHLETAAPAIVEALAAASSDQSDLVATLLDASIRLGAIVPADVLLRHYERWPVQSLILLQQASGNRSAALLNMLQRSSGDEWYAVANMLAQQRAPGFAAALLAATTMTLEVTISEGGTEFTYADSPMTLAITDRLVLHDPAFPPLAIYRLHVGGGPGSVVVSTGPRPVHYTRTVHNGAVVFAARGESSGPLDEDRLEYLGTVLRQPVDLEIAFLFQATMAPGAARDAVAQCRREALRRYADTVRALRLAGLLTEAELAGVVPRVRVLAHDRRSDRSTLLPELSSVEPEPDPTAVCPSVR